MREHDGDVAEMPPYFLGSIVLIKGLNTREAEIIDGQQRLTTLTLLLLALRANMAQYATEITPLIYKKGSTIQNRKDHFRLSLGKRDREFFRTYVQREDGFSKLIALDNELSDAQEKLRKNAGLFQTHVESPYAPLRLDDSPEDASRVLRGLARPDHQPWGEAFCYALQKA